MFTWFQAVNATLCSIAQQKAVVGEEFFFQPCDCAEHVLVVVGEETDLCGDGSPGSVIFEGNEAVGSYIRLSYGAIYATTYPSGWSKPSEISPSLPASDRSMDTKPSFGGRKGKSDVGWTSVSAKRRPLQRKAQTPPRR